MKELLKKVAKFGKPIILSTGMCTMEEVKKSINAIYDEGNEKLILVREVFDKYNLISGLHTFMSKKDKIYENL